MNSPEVPPGEVSSSTPRGPTMRLHVLSPSLPQLTFPDISASTTILELKCKIREAVSTRPGPQEQRLIHRGRVLANDADTLLDIFGQQAVGFGRSTPYVQLRLTLHPDTRPGSS